VSENIAIAIVAPIQPEEFYDEVWEGVWEATFDLAAFGVHVENLTTDHRDVERQRQILTELLDAHFAAIGIAPAHTSALDDLIAEHARRGTAVVTLYGDAAQSSRSAFVGADARRSGALAGEVLIKLMGGRGHVLAIPGDQAQSQLAGRYTGFQAELTRQGACMVETRLDATGSELSVALSANWQIADGLYIGDGDLSNVVEVLEQSRLRVPCVGFTNTALARGLLERGLVSAVVDESRHQQGYFAVQKAYQAAIQPEGVDSIYVPSTVAFTANAAELQQSLHDAFELLVRQRTEVLVSYKTRLEKANAELLNLSITDPLTGLMNRRQFETSLSQEAARARRYGAMSLLMVDVNLFKHVNDTYGHQIGDEALKLVAKVLNSCTRSTDICARLGGDEFAIILPHTDGEEAGAVRERIMRCMSHSPVTAGDASVPITVSVGLGTLPGDADFIDGLVAAADADMYRVKQASRVLS
jgi:diguanylate cyclase (GGDEF)-like protein